MAAEYQSPPDATYVKKELLKRAFHREVAIPYELGDPAEATVKNGMLCLKWPTPEYISERIESPVRKIHIRTEDSVMDNGGGGE